MDEQLKKIVKNNKDSVREQILNYLDNNEPEKIGTEKLINGFMKEFGEIGKVWYNNFTEEHYLAAAEYLRGLDEVLCVETCDGEAYMGGEFWVHTNYLTEKIVDPLITHLDMDIRGMKPTYPDTGSNFDCVEEHGACIEINMAVYTPCDPCSVKTFNNTFKGKEVFWSSKESKERYKLFDAGFD